MKAKKHTKVLHSFAELGNVLSVKYERGNIVYDKSGKSVFTPTEDGNWLVAHDPLKEKL